MDRIIDTRRTLLVCSLLAAVILAAYWSVTGHDFVNYDDPDYVTTNPHVQGGLTWAGLVWAFGQIHGETTYWHPVSWVSHMVDCELYGLKPWGHHLTSLLLHAANAVLVFLVFRKMTGAFWRSAVLAGLFALHPLQVDSVAWVAERKNLLSTFFWLLTTWTYVRYAQARMQNAESEKARLEAGGQCSVVSSRWSVVCGPWSIFYLLSLCCFALGLMCKPVLVTLPFVLLLLDYWPLGRMQNAECRMQKAKTADTHHPSSVAALRRVDAPRTTLHIPPPLVLEKLPFLTLAVVSSLITITAHRALGMLNSVSRLPWDIRLENALVSYVRYLGKAFWPSSFAVFYPYPAAWPMWEVVTCGLLLLVISGLVLGTARSCPWLLVGWFWFLGVLVPFNGLVQAGEQAMADRFMYIPAIGIIVALVWGLHGLAKAGRYQLLGLSVGGAALVLCLALTRQQVGYWKDSETLFRHALAVTEENWLAHNNLGAALVKKGQMDGAIHQYQETIRLKPDYADAHNNLGYVLAEKGQMDEAIRQFQETLRLKPDHTGAHNNLGAALIRNGQMDEAVRECQEAIRLKPDNAIAHNNLGIALARKGQIDGAIRQFQEVIRLKPNYGEAHANFDYLRTDHAKAPPGAFANSLDGQGKYAEVIRFYQAALKAQPDQECILNNLAWLLATCPDGTLRNGPEAVRLATRACELTGYTQPLLIGTLAASQAEAGNFSAAIATAERAAALATSLRLEDVAAKNEELLKLYRARKAFHEAQANRP